METVLVAVQTIAFVAALIYVIRYFGEIQQRRDHAHTAQVAELLTRIQHPERLPIRTVEWGRRPESEPDEISQVGRIGAA